MSEWTAEDAAQLKVLEAKRKAAREALEDAARRALLRLDEADRIRVAKEFVPHGIRPRPGLR